jgi:hypothetical protein
MNPAGMALDEKIIVSLYELSNAIRIGLLWD